MAIYSTAGSKLFIGDVLAQQTDDFEAADFSSVTWVEIKQVETLGAFGDAAQSISINLIGEAREKVLKGSRSAGTMEVTCAHDFSDAGQAAVIAAEKTPYDYAFKVEFADKPSTGASPKNSTRRFIGKVMNATEQLEGANNVTKLVFSLSINSNIVKTDASET